MSSLLLDYDRVRNSEGLSMAVLVTSWPSDRMVDKTNMNQ